MKATNIVKVNPIAEIVSPTLLQCKNGECGSCPNNTGKMLWIPGSIVNLDGTTEYVTLNFQYNFFNKSEQSTSPIKYNMAGGFNSLNSTTFSYSNPPNKAWAVSNNAIDNFSLSPNQMTGTDIIKDVSFTVQSTGGWLFFRQPNPANNNVHDALCFEYNHEKRLITFRSF
jgi:hypothetical protein